MRFRIDENIEFRLAALLHAQGHDVTAIAHNYIHALSDRDVLVIAWNERRVLCLRSIFGMLEHDTGFVDAVEGALGDLHGLGTKGTIARYLSTADA